MPRLTVTEARTVIADPTTGDSLFTLRNRSATDSIDLGKSTSLVFGQGFELGPGEAIDVNLGGEGAMYAIAGAGKSVRVDVLAT